ncbi:hypothetical protein U1Q18_042518 [Sarracenia purpurea var. burkii]
MIALSRNVVGLLPHVTARLALTGLKKLQGRNYYCLKIVSQSSGETVHVMSEELADAISQIHGFVLVLEKEAMSFQSSSFDGDGLSQKIRELSASFDNVIIHGRISLIDFVLDLSHVLNKANELQFSVLGFKNNGAETNSSDCIDKVALPEDKVVRDASRERNPNVCGNFSDSTSDPDIPHVGNFCPTFESNATSWKCALEEFEQMKLEKDNVILDLAKMHGESYKSLEARAEELRTEVNFLRAKTESLDNELKEERRNHQDALAKFKDLQENLKRRNESSAVADIDLKSNQEVAAAAEKLAECQETIFLLGKQLKALRPQPEFMASPCTDRGQTGAGFTEEEEEEEEEPTTSGMNLNSQHFDHTGTDFTSTNLHRVGGESPLDTYNCPLSPSDTEAHTLLRSPISPKDLKHQSAKSGSSSSSSSTPPEKHSRGFSRFFSGKGKKWLLVFAARRLTGNSWLVRLYDNWPSLG